MKKFGEGTKLSWREKYIPGRQSTELQKINLELSPKAGQAEWLESGSCFNKHDGLSNQATDHSAKDKWSVMLIETALNTEVLNHKILP